jgi:hypothetical protein
MGVTAIKHIDNDSEFNIDIKNKERGQHFLVHAHSTAGGNLDVDIWIPWCTSQVDFNNNHYIMVTKLDKVTEQPVGTYWVWQNNENSRDRVRFNTEGKWKQYASSVPGDASVDGNRSLEILSDGTMNFSRIAG